MLITQTKRNSCRAKCVCPTKRWLTTAEQGLLELLGQLSHMAPQLSPRLPQTLHMPIVGWGKLPLEMRCAHVEVLVAELLHLCCHRATVPTANRVLASIFSNKSIA
jgi:hypothetical protein